ncbi:MAG: ROK family protein [Balneolaceae bacterium]
MIAIGIDLGGTNIKAALVEKKKGIIEKLSIPTEADKGKGHVLDRIKLAIDQLLEKRKDITPVGIGIGTPGVVSLDHRIVRNPPNLKGWIEVHVAEEMKARTGFDCVIDNDANLAALGTSRFGIGMDFDSLIMITLGTGVGGGVVFNRELFRGSTGSAAELGHVIIDYEGPYSNSNTRGGIEAYIGQRFLSRNAAKTIQQNPDNPLFIKFKDNFEQLEPIDLYNAAEDGNQLAIDLLRSTGEKLGYAIVNYIHVLDIRKIVVSGGVANAGKWILEPAREAALSYLMPPFHDGFEILYEPLGNEVALYGASSLAFEKL